MHRPNYYELLANERQQRLLLEAQANRQLQEALNQKQDTGSPVWQSLAARLSNFLRARTAAPSQS